MVDEDGGKDASQVGRWKLLWTVFPDGLGWVESSSQFWLIRLLWAVARLATLTMSAIKKREGGEG